MDDEDIEQEFEEIIQEAIAKAGDIDCSRETYETNLRGWIEQIQNEMTSKG